MIIIKNTIEEFKDCDKKSIIQSAGAMLLDNIKSEYALTDPTSLNIFRVLSFAVFIY